MRAYVVGGGPSAAEFDWGGHGRGFVVACGEAAHRLPFAPQFQLSVDWIYWRTHDPRRGSLGVWVDLGDGPDHVSRLKSPLLRLPGAKLWECSWAQSWLDGLMVGGSSGPAAMNFAALLGADEVHLVGIDLDGDDGRPYARWEEGFIFACAQLRARGVEVVAHGRWRP